MIKNISDIELSKMLKPVSNLPVLNYNMCYI